MNVGDRVFDKADPRHVGIIRTTCRGGAVATANIRWEDTGWLSSRIPLRDLRKAPRDGKPLTEIFIMRRALANRTSHGEDQ